MNTTTSKDSTRIAYLATGTGPGLIIVPGNNRMAHNYEKLAARLADRFTVYVMERRGRGESGPQGESYTIEREVEDLQAIIGATSAAVVFGHSYGGLIALQAGRVEPRIKKLIAYEPGVSINGSFDVSWLPQFEQAFRAGKQAKAMAIFLKKAQISEVDILPFPFLYCLAGMLLSRKSGKEMRALMPTTPPEIREVQRADSDGRQYANITADTLLLGGERGSKPLLAAMSMLQDIIPQVHCQVFEGLNHNAPDLGPFDQVVEAIKNFAAVAE